MLLFALFFSFFLDALEGGKKSKGVTIHAGSAPVEQCVKSFLFYVLNLRPSAGAPTFSPSLCGRAVAAVMTLCKKDEERVLCFPLRLEPDIGAS